ncbi:hypothetical protein GWI33_001025 [Rhynchophorus ferrugineus]|uniref:Uncharacterized protein n=1 Tax=Rhynchophorus ferrugineus TaxID=354439 RepID=A0A834ISQ8_RHYFE|nr:hypothetical protein GWI33_001025 [Rhynchophorus ferrugineus]
MTQFHSIRLTLARLISPAHPTGKSVPCQRYERLTLRILSGNAAAIDGHIKKLSNILSGKWQPIFISLIRGCLVVPPAPALTDWRPLSHTATYASMTQFLVRPLFADKLYADLLESVADIVNQIPVPRPENGSSGPPPSPPYPRPFLDRLARPSWDNLHRLIVGH